MIGICGNEKASDARVTVDLEAKGIHISIESKFKKMFGHHMEKAIYEVLESLNIQDAKILLEDFGALDFVIKARCKTAIRRAQKGEEL